MRVKSVLSQVLFLSTLVLVITFTGACATFPPQTKPLNPEAFAGEWAGIWSDYGGGNGGVDLTIGKPHETGIRLWVRLTHSRFGSWETVAKFTAGELVIDRPSLWMVLRLYGEDRLEAEYHNRINNAKGTWSLTRKKK